MNEITTGELFIRETGLNTNLSPSRVTGLGTIVKQMKSFAGLTD